MLSLNLNYYYVYFNIYNKINSVDNYSINTSFKEFFDKRKNAKDELYKKVVYLAVYIFILSFILTITSYAFAYYSLTFNITTIVESFLRVTAICIYSTITTDKIDLIELLHENRKFRLSFAIIYMVAGIYLGYVLHGFPYVQTYIMWLWSFAVLIKVILPKMLLIN